MYKKYKDKNKELICPPPKVDAYTTALIKTNMLTTKVDILVAMLRYLNFLEVFGFFYYVYIQIYFFILFDSLIYKRY